MCTFVFSITKHLMIFCFDLNQNATEASQGLVTVILLTAIPLCSLQRKIKYG